MSLKYCFTTLSVSNLKKVSDYYSGFSYQNISDFQKNASAQNEIQFSIDIIYIYSQVLKDPSELWGVFSGNILITNDALIWVDESGEFHKIPENASVYLLRMHGISAPFLSFLSQYAKKRWNIDVITPVDDLRSPLSTKLHSLFYTDPDNYPSSIIPYICHDSDFSLLWKYIQQSKNFGKSVIIKKEACSGWEGIKIFPVDSALLDGDIAVFLADRTKGYIIMECLETKDMEYRVYWIKKAWVVRIIGVHGKERINGNVLHNVSKGNILRKLDDDLPLVLEQKIMEYCWKIPELHGWLDILEWTNGEYCITENNRLTGYLNDDEDAYLAREWLDSIANCYK